jgi:hypothetical protein
VVTPEHAVQRALPIPGNRIGIMEGIVEQMLEMLEEGLTPAQTA